MLVFGLVMSQSPSHQIAPRRAGSALDPQAGLDASGAPTREQTRVYEVATSVATWLQSEGHAVHEVTAPPYRHPHQNQTDTVTNLLVAFALAALALAAVLVASTLGGMLAAQSRQIGIMKTVGASTGVIVRLYATMTVVVAAIATALAAAPAWFAGNGLAKLVGTILNLDIASVPPSPHTIVLIVGRLARVDKIQQRLLRLIYHG